jgi:hypothetical protein
MTKRQFEKRNARLFLLTASLALALLLIVIALTVTAVIFLFAHFRAEEAANAMGRQSLNFRVHYLDNDIFSENPIPPNTDFLMSFTDFIEIDNAFTANFSEIINIQYSYNAEERLVIRPFGDSGTVFEETLVLSESSGEIVADRLQFNANNNGLPGGSYVVYPKTHIETYFAFIEEQARIMAEENVVAQGLRGFSGELLIEFTYRIYAPEIGLNEIINYGYRIPLTNEIYSISTVGVSNFEWENSERGGDITLPIVAIYAVTFTASVFGLFYFIKLLGANPNKHQRKADWILKKYFQEIIIYDKPVNFTKYEPMVVQDFSELLKLAINLNKHIMCFRSEISTEFVVIVDDYACLYVIYYDGTIAERFRQQVRIFEENEEEIQLRKTYGSQSLLL